MLAALRYRAKTGLGQYIDLSQVEASIPFIAPAVLDYSVNRRVLRRAGNRRAGAVPHGVFPCAGEDRWIAIEVEREREWRALCTVTRQPWADDARFATHETRAQHEDALEALLAAWTADQIDLELEQALQAAGVPAHAVLDSLQGDRDPQLQALNHFVEVDSAALGHIPVERTRQALSRTPADPSWVGTYGEDNDYILREILRLDDDVIAEIAASGALQ